MQTSQGTFIRNWSVRVLDVTSLYSDLIKNGIKQAEFLRQFLQMFIKFLVVYDSWLVVSTCDACKQGLTCHRHHQVTTDNGVVQESLLPTSYLLEVVYIVMALVVCWDIRPSRER